jgi:hypothetical protein
VGLLRALNRVDEIARGAIDTFVDGDSKKAIATFVNASSARGYFSILDIVWQHSSS